MAVQCTKCGNRASSRDFILHRIDCYAMGPQSGPPPEVVVVPDYLPDVSHFRHLTQRIEALEEALLFITVQGARWGRLRERDLMHVREILAKVASIPDDPSKQGPGSGSPGP
jgi:hypothetical protein